MKPAALTELLNADTPLAQNTGADQLVKHELCKLEVRRFETCRQLN